MVTSVRARSGLRNYFICKNTPTFSGPRQQLNYIIEHKLPQQVFRFPDRYETIVRNSLQEYMINLDIRYLYLTNTSEARKVSPAATTTLSSDKD